MAILGGRRGQARAVYAAMALATADQVFTAPNMPEPLVSDTITGQNGVIASLDGSFEIQHTAIYNFSTFPNIFKNSGGQAEVDVFYEIDRGSGWVTEPNSNSRVTLLANTNNTDIVYDFPLRAIPLDAGWKIRFQMQVSDTAVSLASISPGGAEPDIPANFISLYSVGAQ